MHNFNIVPSLLQPGKFSVYYVDKHGAQPLPLIVEATLSDCIRAIDEANLSDKR